MKLRHEKIETEKGQSYRLLVNPNLRNKFYWHHHKEYELVYICGKDGVRHVDNHIEPFKYDDLVFLGPDIPHLNFDYGMPDDHYQKIVLQLEEEVWSPLIYILQELQSVKSLFQRARSGLIFQGKTKEKIGKKLLEFSFLNDIERINAVIEILTELADSQEYRNIQAKPITSNYSQKTEERLQRVLRMIEDNLEKGIDFSEAVELSCMTKSSFSRFFKEKMECTFSQYIRNQKISRSKVWLHKGASIEETAELSGFSSLPYFSKEFKKIEGISPKQYQMSLQNIT